MKKSQNFNVFRHSAARLVSKLADWITSRQYSGSFTNYLNITLLCYLLWFYFLLIQNFERSGTQELERFDIRLCIKRISVFALMLNDSLRLYRLIYHLELRWSRFCRLWNNPPLEVRSAPSVKALKSLTFYFILRFDKLCIAFSLWSKYFSLGIL